MDGFACNLQFDFLSLSTCLDLFLSFSLALPLSFFPLFFFFFFRSVSRLHSNGVYSAIRCLNALTNQLTASFPLPTAQLLFLIPVCLPLPLLSANKDAIIVRLVIYANQLTSI